MIWLYIALLLLGLAAIDPLGIIAMPILLAQRKPYIRSAIFLSGSFVSLIAMGLLFSKGLGISIVRLEQQYVWILPIVELLAGLVLLVTGVYILVRIKQRTINDEPSSVMVRRLHLGNWGIFVVGVLLVAIQSVVDVVFAIAMIKLEALQVSFGQLVGGIVAYAIGALLLQIIIVIMYLATPPKLRKTVIERVRSVAERYAHRILVVLSFVLGGTLMMNSILTAMGHAIF